MFTLTLHPNFRYGIYVKYKGLTGQISKCSDPESDLEQGYYFSFSSKLIELTFSGEGEGIELSRVKIPISSIEDFSEKSMKICKELALLFETDIFLSQFTRGPYYITVFIKIDSVFKYLSKRELASLLLNESKEIRRSASVILKSRVAKHMGTKVIDSNVFTS